MTWKEGSKLPAVIIELSSDATRAQDLGQKLRTYQWLGIPVYVTFDPSSAELTVRHLGPGQRYHDAPPDDAGRYEIPPLGLRLGRVSRVYRGAEAEWLRWFGEDGVVLPTGAERAAEAVARADAERSRADAERARREDAEARLAAALDRLGDRAPS